jgi:transposase
MGQKWTTCVDPPALHRFAVHRFAGLFRPLAGDERNRLRESLQRRYDPLHPIVVTPNGEIVDGRNRRDLCCELEIPAVVVEREFADDAEIMAYIVSANLARRHLDQRERRELAGRLVMNGTSTRQAAKTAGVSKATAQRAAANNRSGVSSETPPPMEEARTNGADGKSYPATSRRVASGKTNRAVSLGQVGDKLAKSMTRLRYFVDRELGVNPLPSKARETAARYAVECRALAAVFDAIAEGEPANDARAALDQAVKTAIR